MARGWESKEIESQMQAAAERVSRAKLPPQDPAQIARLRDRESLELSRTRVLGDLATAANPNYRALLERSLDFLNSKLADLDGKL